VTYKTGSGLDDWIYWHHIHSTWNYRQLQRLAQINCSAPKLRSWWAAVSKLDSFQLYYCSVPELYFITTLHGPRGKQRLLLSRIVSGVFTDPLPSNGRSIVVPVDSRGNVFAESLPNNGSIRHNML
jgi:hypothetical protein